MLLYTFMSLWTLCRSNADKDVKTEAATREPKFSLDITSAPIYNTYSAEHVSYMCDPAAAQSTHSATRVLLEHRSLFRKADTGYVSDTSVQNHTLEQRGGVTCLTLRASNTIHLREETLNFTQTYKIKALRV